MSLAILLQLADGRLPTGGHAHSGGIEEAVAGGRVCSIDDLGAYLHGRLSTVGRVDAALAVAAWHRSPDGAAVDGEATARCPSPALRAASRAQGRGLVRAGRRMWPGSTLDAVSRELPDGPMWPVAVGLVGAAAGLEAVEVGLLAAHAAVTSPAWAAVRLLGSDPFAVVALLARLAPAIGDVAHEAAGSTEPDSPLVSLPALSGPLTEIGAEAHGTWEVRLFAS